jgi:hypothetical protein
MEGITAKMFDFSIIKEHPYIAGIIVVIGGIVIYLSMTGSSSSSSSAAAPDSGLSGSDLQLANLNAAQNLSAAQYGAQVTTAQIAGQVASQQSSDQVAIVNAEANSALAIVQTQTTGAVQATQITSDATTDQTRINAQAATDIATVTAGDQLQGIQSQVNGQVAIANNNLTFDNSVIAAAGTDKSRSSTGYAQIISSLQGQGPQAIAANQPSQVAGSPSAILKAINPTGVLSAISSFF